MKINFGFFIGLAAIFLSVMPARSQQATSEQLWAAIADGRAIAMMRHALAPGGGDPVNFVLGDCSTQRNLSDEGRKQAIEVGEAFRINGIGAVRLLSSQWCRCAETARLLNLGDVETFAPLNSFFADRKQSGPQTDALRQFLQFDSLSSPLLLVTHQVNITALTGIFPRSGEIVVFTIDPSGKVEVLGSL